MPFDANGNWIEENESVASRVADLTSKDSPIMQQARTSGLQQANRRGLLNSSIAIGAAENEAYRAALPIASQEAGQMAQRNLTGLNFQGQRGLQQQDIQSRERLAEGDRAAQRERLELELGSRERLAGTELDAARERLGLELGQRERDSARNFATQQQSLVNSAVQNANAAYAQMFSNIANNPDLPADVRDRYLGHIQAVQTANLDVIQQIFNVQIDWPTPTQTPVSPVGTPSFRPPTG